jgi:hypothetical protein
MYSWNRYCQVATHKNKNIIDIKPGKKHVHVKMRESGLGFVNPSRIFIQMNVP